MFPLPIEEAAKSLGIGQTMLKHYCRKFGIPRWPYRKRQSVVILIQSIEEFAKERPLTVQPALNKLRSFLAQVGGQLAADAEWCGYWPPACSKINASSPTASSFCSG